MTELETSQRAKMYIDKLANGINPLDDTPTKDDDVINNVRVSGCLFFVSDTLRKVVENLLYAYQKAKRLKCNHITSDG